MHRIRTFLQLYEDEHLINVSSRLCDAGLFRRRRDSSLQQQHTSVSYVRRGKTQQVVVLQGTHHLHTITRGGGAEDARGQSAEVTEIDIHYLVCI